MTTVPVRTASELATQVSPATRVAVGTPGWVHGYARLLMASDALASLVASSLGVALRFGSGASHVGAVPYWCLPLIMAPLWVAVMAMSRAYEGRFLGVGSVEFHRVFNAATRFTALVAVAAFAAHSQVARSAVCIALPSASVLTLLGRVGARGALHRRRRAGACVHRVLLVGSVDSVSQLARRLGRDIDAGYQVVGACLPEGTGEVWVEGHVVSPLGRMSDAAEIARAIGADTVAVGASSGLTHQAMQQLSWDLECTGIDLVVAPALPDVAASRLTVRPVAGLPLLHVEEPQFTGLRKAVKHGSDRAAATLALLLLLPAFVVVGLVVSLSSRGPALFRQTRVGQHGEEFTVFKFRTMFVSAEEELARLAHLNDRAEGILFKIRMDPRVTPVGRFLRRWSIDEMPQLLNVALGHMSLVGPRPPLPAEVARYGDDVRRRLLVRPGLTGLWQVSGRSDLTWDEAVRLDLSYVANWTPGLDLKILWRTLAAVVAGRGAY